MPSKEETSDRLEAILAEDESGDGPYPELDDDVDELEEEHATQVADSNGEARSSSREYIVLVNGGKDTWSQVKSPVEATSAEAAIRSLGEDLQDGSTYVAVPKRNWNPVPVTIKTTTTISFT